MPVQWNPPRWVRYTKHQPPPHVPWKDLVKGSKENSYYHPSIDESEQEALELKCVSEGKLFRSSKAKRMYWMKMDRIIGAADEEETDYLYAEWATSGEVHGRPMTASQLKKKGAQL